MALRFFRSRRRKTSTKSKKEKQPFFTPNPMPIQPRLEVGPNDDQYEKEADAMGEKAAKAGGDARAFVASEYNYSFKNVKIHTGAKSEKMNQALKAHAFTQGNHIHFNKGKYQPASREGKKLLAHELTHVVQQGRGAKESIQRQDNPDPAPAAPAPAPEVAPAPAPAPAGPLSLADFRQQMNDLYGVSTIRPGTMAEQNRRWGLPENNPLPNWAPWNPGDRSETYNHILDSFADFNRTFGAVPEVNTLLFYRMYYDVSFPNGRDEAPVIREDSDVGGVYGNGRIAIFSMVRTRRKTLPFARSNPEGNYEGPGRPILTSAYGGDENAAPIDANLDAETTTKRVLIHELGHALARDVQRVRGELAAADQTMMIDWIAAVGWRITGAGENRRTRLYDINAPEVQAAIGRGEDPPAAFVITAANWNDPNWIDQPLSEYSVTGGAGEDFAEAVLVYIENPNLLQARSPVRFNFIHGRRAQWLPALRAVNPAPAPAAPAAGD